MQFTLQTLMLSVLVVASALGAFGAWGLVVAGILLAVVAYIRNSVSMLQATARCLLVILCIFLVLGLLSAALSRLGVPRVSVRDDSRRVQCQNNLKQLVVSLWSYQEQHGWCFPPAYIADANGKPMHSWRVLILPYLDGGALYDQYNFNEPWNGPSNSKLKRKKISYAFRCPSSNTTANTNYVAVVGSRTAWQNGESVKLKDIKDGPENTILLIEFPGSDIHWMKPRDLSMEEVLRRFNPTSGRGLSPVHVRENGYFYHDTPVIHVAFADGSVRAIPVGVSREELEGLLTIDGGETVDMESLYRKRLDLSNCIAVGVLVVSTLLLLLRPLRRGDAVIGR